MNPGLLKHRILFFKTKTETDNEGFKTVQLSEVLRTKCAIKQTTYSDNNRSSSKSLDSAKTLVYCTIRYNRKIDEACIASLYGKQYRIKTFTNINYENRILELVLQDG